MAQLDRGGLLVRLPYRSRGDLEGGVVTREIRNCTVAGCTRAADD